MAISNHEFPGKALAESVGAPTVSPASESGRQLLTYTGLDVE
jgi:hypothetical protein